MNNADKKLTSAQEWAEMTLPEVSFIVDLNYGNYRYYMDEVLSNVMSIAQVSNLDIPALSKLCGVCKKTLKRLLIRNESFSVRFLTINKLNNFVGDVLLQGSRNEGDA